MVNSFNGYVLSKPCILHSAENKIFQLLRAVEVGFEVPKSTITNRERKGEQSHFWQGGKTKESDLLRTSAEYKEWRLAVFTRDNFTCQKCGQRKRNIEAHHIKERCKYPELMFDVDNGLTLCHECHKETDNYGWKARWNND